MDPKGSTNSSAWDTNKAHCGHRAAIRALNCRDKYTRINIKQNVMKLPDLKVPERVSFSSESPSHGIIFQTISPQSPPKGINFKGI